MIVRRVIKEEIFDEKTGEISVVDKDLFCHINTRGNVDLSDEEVESVLDYVKQVRKRLGK